MGRHLYIVDGLTGTIRPCPPGARLRVGRANATPAPDFACDDKHVSRLHCELVGESAEEVKVVDKSTYGTFVNGTKVAGEALARAGDEIRLGHAYRLGLVETPPATQMSPGTPSTAAWSGTRIENLTETADPDAASPLDFLGKRYKVVRELGRGGMGAVYEAEDLVRKTRCAVKVLHAAGRASPDLLRRFQREAAIGKELSGHPHIVGIYDIDTVPETGELLCAMDFVNGRTLTRYVQEKPALEESVRIVAEVARALAFAHSKKVVHRDVKPDNVLVDEKGAARLADFGIGKAADECGLTATGASLGTPRFMAPEQLEDAKRAFAPCDAYGLGGLLYFVLTEAPPHKGQTLTALLQEIKSGALVPPRQLNAQAPAELEALCLECLRHDPARRPDAATVASKLEAWHAKK